MARFLVVVPPLTGHINPTLAVGRRLLERGHRVAWAGFLDPVRSLMPPDVEQISMLRAIPQEVLDAARAKLEGLRGASSLHALWEEFVVPLAFAMAPGVQAALDQFEPDVVLSDQQALAGALVAQRQGIAWATSATTSAELVDPFSGFPRVREWIEKHIRELQDKLEIPAERRCDPRFSERLILLFSSRELVGHPLDPQVACVGPSLDARPQNIPFDWDVLRPGPKLFVSLGTVSARHGGRFFRAVIEAFAGAPLQVILVAPPHCVEDAPENFVVRERVPQLALLDRVDAVLCHGGHNTVCEALSRSLPLVVSPIRDDQPIVADQVVAAGAGLRIHFGRARAADVRGAVDRVLGEPGFRAAADRIRASFAEAGGPGRAADLLEQLC